jgi:hypothetical protein
VCHDRHTVSFLQEDITVKKECYDPRLPILHIICHNGKKRKPTAAYLGLIVCWNDPLIDPIGFVSDSGRTGRKISGLVSIYRRNFSHYISAPMGDLFNHLFQPNRRRDRNSMVPIYKKFFERGIDPLSEQLGNF